jgi:hypothetical protein
VAGDETVVRNKVDHEVFGTPDLVGSPSPTSFHAIASDHLVAYSGVQEVALNQAMVVAVHEAEAVLSISWKEQTLDPLSQIVYFQGTL